MLVLREVAVGAVHPLLEVDVLQMHGLLELVGIVEGDDLVVGVEQVAFAVALVDGHEVPAVAVIVGELRVLRLGVEARETFSRKSVSSTGRARAAPSGLRVEAGALLGFGRVAAAPSARAASASVS